jgi:hypothetical protein
MDKLEYIPGDLIKFATNTYTIVNFEENFLQNKICYALISTNSTKTAFVADRDILPIPLTPEILEKNGWKIEDVNPNDLSNIVSKGIMYRAIKDKEILFFQKGASVFTCPLNWRKIEIRYVHQLQHLLFGLGINHEMKV